MNYQKHKKAEKLQRIVKELELELPEADEYNPEAGADIRWSIISLLRAIGILRRR